MEKVPGKDSIHYEELIQLLKMANTAEEISNRRYEIGALLSFVEERIKVCE